MRNKNFLFRFWPILFLLAIWFIFSFPYFFQHKVPFPSTYQVNHFHPWSDYEKFWGPVKNGAMPDIVDQIYPWKHFTISMLKKGEVGLWNPYSFAGNPHLANVQSAVLSPFNILFLILPFIDAWSLLILVQPLLAGLFTYLLLGELKVSRVGSALGGVTFMFCGFVVVWMAYGTLAMAIIFLPLALYCIQKITSEEKNKRLIFLLLLSISVAISFFSGHFQMSSYFALYVFLFLLFKFITTSRRLTLYAFSFFCIGLLVSTLQIIPSMQFYQHSVRSEIFIQGGGIPWHYLITMIAPDFFGNPVTRNTWFGHYAEWASFIGIMSFLLALFAIRNNKTVLFFLSTGILMLLLAIDTPLHGVLSSLKIPVLSTSIPSRIIVLFSFSFAVLSGFGFDNLRDLIAKKSVRGIAIPFLVCGLILSLIWVEIFAGIVTKENMPVAQRNLLLPTAIFIGGVITTVLVYVRKQFIFMLIVFFLLAVSFDGLRFAQKWMPFDPRELVFPDVQVITAIRENIGNGRIFGNIRAQVDTYYEIPSIEGYDPLYIARYGEFVRGAQEGSFIPAERSVVRIDRYGKYVDRLIDLLGVNLIFHPRGDTNQGWAYPVWKNTNRYERIYQDDKFELYRNNEALPRAKLFYAYEVVDDKEKILKKFYSKDFDFRKRIILEEEIANIPEDRGVKNEGKTEILLYSPNKIKIAVTTESPAILFLSDNYYSTWKAKVNSQEVKIYRADYTFRAVEVPSGDSIVEFTNTFIF